MERKIGEVFDYKGKTLEVVKLEDSKYSFCEDCYFRSCISCNKIGKITGECCGVLRNDLIPVIFKEVKK